MVQACPKCGYPEVADVECPRCGVDVARYRDYMQSVGTQEWSAAESLRAARPAGFWIRAAALFIDSIFLSAMQGAVGMLALFLWGEQVEHSRVFQASSRAFGIFFGVLYTVLFHWLWGQTFGKMAVRVRVVTLAGEPLNLRTAILRDLGYVVSAVLLGIGYLMAGLRSDKRALHDLLAGTRVERL